MSFCFTSTDSALRPLNPSIKKAIEDSLKAITPPPPRQKHLPHKRFQQFHLSHLPLNLSQSPVIHRPGAHINIHTGIGKEGFLEVGHSPGVVLIVQV